jgi:folate-dependent phosphoribosylglycinamide formyltransferase PurN
MKTTAVFLTADSALVCPIVETAHRISDLKIEAVLYDNQSDWPRPRPLKRLRLLVGRQGVLGALKRLLIKVISPFTGIKQAEHTAAMRHGREIRRTCERLGLPFYEYNNINCPEAVEILRQIAPDYGFVVSTRILQPYIVNTARRFMVNVHQGLIPEYRGGDVTFWSLYNGAQVTGVTFHIVEEQVDSGAVLDETRIPLEYDWRRFETRFEPFLEEVEKQMDRIAVEHYPKVIEALVAGKLTPRNIVLSEGRRYRRHSRSDARALRRILRERHGGPET